MRPARIQREHRSPRERSGCSIPWEPIDAVEPARPKSSMPAEALGSVSSRGGEPAVSAPYGDHSAVLSDKAESESGAEDSTQACEICYSAGADACITCLTTV